MFSYKELIYEYLANLDYNDIKQFCLTNKYLYNLSQTEMFKRLINKKHYLMIRKRIELRFNRKKNRYIRKTINYLITNPNTLYAYLKSGNDSRDYQGDQLIVNCRALGIFDISEKFSSYEESLLFQIFENETDFSSVPFDQLLECANAYDNDEQYRDNYAVERLHKYGPKSVLPYWDKRGNYSFWFDTKITLNRCSYDKIYRVFLLMIEKGWKFDY